MPDLGLYAMRFALVVALLGIGAGVFAGLRGRPEWTRVSERASHAVFALLTVCMISLWYALATNDFTLEFVARHSARGMPLHYRLGALWGGQSGSLLLWAWLLMAYGSAALLANRNQNRTLMPWVSACLLGNATFFLLLLNVATSPFDRVPFEQVVSDGNGLNPLLQHPVMMIHPVMLYLGFTGFAVPFAFGFAALVTGELGTAWFRTTRRWCVIAWMALGAGIVLGGRWAYEVLGWGGYWAWDPVENASLMPWLAATAFLHSVMIQEKRGMLKNWNLALIGLTYVMCLFGTFLTRSGIVQSVHAFTDAGWFKPIFLAYVLVVAVAYSIAVFYRRKELRTANRLESLISRESSFVINNWIFMVLLAVVWGFTMLPVFSESISGQRMTLGPTYYNVVTGPLALVLLFLTGVGPLVAWRRARWASLQRQFMVPVALGVIVAVVLGGVFWEQIGYWTLGCWGLATFAAATIVQEYVQAIRARRRSKGESILGAFGALLRKNQRRYGGYIVHMGTVIMLLGISGAAFNQESLENMKPGDTAAISNYRFQYLTAEPITKQHYGGATARVVLYRDEDPLAVMVPEQRMYWLEQQPSSIPSIYSTWIEDIYIILTAVESNGSATIKVYRNPLVNWIWAGAILFGVGGVAIMWPQVSGKRAAA